VYITIPRRDNVPETEIFVKILKKKPAPVFCWNRSVLVLIHGGPGGNHTLYADIEDSLLDIADLVILDLRGCGFSKKISPQHCTLDNHIDDLAFILNAMSIPKPIIHGCSYGALVTLGFSIKYPEVLSMQILSSCMVSGKFIEKAKNNLNKLGTAQQIQAAERLWNGTFETSQQFTEYYNILAPLYFFKNTPITPSSETVNKIPYNIDLVNLAFTTFLLSFDFSDKLTMVKASTLIFSGKYDWICSTDEAERLHYGISNSTLIILNDCGHFPWKDQREIFLSKIEHFIKGKIH
jgi:proline iminopeptidase